MNDQLTALANRVAMLERNGRRWKAASVVMACLCLVGVFAGAAQKKTSRIVRADKVIAGKIQVVNAKGEPRVLLTDYMLRMKPSGSKNYLIALGMFSDTQTALSMGDPESNASISLILDGAKPVDHGFADKRTRFGPQFRIKGGNGEDLLEFIVDESGTPSLELSGKTARP